MTAPVAVMVVASRGGSRLGRALASVAWASERLAVDPARRLGDEAFPPGVTRDASSVRAPWLLLLGEDESVSPDLATEIVETLSRSGSAAAYRIGQDVEAFGGTLRLPGASVRLARRDGATVRAKAGLLALQPPAGPIGRLRGRLMTFGAESLAAAMDDLDADSDTLAAVLHACGAQPRLRHLAAAPLLPVARALVARSRSGGRWPRWALGAFSSYRTAVAYAKLWEMRRAEGSLGR